jgi:hypothetical protein
MAAVVHTTAERRRTLPGVFFPNLIPPRLRAPDPDDVVAWDVASLARLFHRTRGGTRPYARAERLAAALQAGTVTLRPVPIAWLPPPAPRHMLTRSLAAAGSPAVTEGVAHARLRLGAYALATAMTAPRDQVLFEHPTATGFRSDVTLVRANGRPALAIECGSISCDTLLDHVGAGGVPAVLILPFAMLADPPPALRGWLLRPRDARSPRLPRAAAVIAAHARLDAP